MSTLGGFGTLTEIISAAGVSLWVTTGLGGVEGRGLADRGGTPPMSLN